MMRDAPLLESSSSSSKKKRQRRRMSFVNAFALVLFCCSIMNLFLALRRNNITSRSFRREGENIVIASSSSFSSSDRGSGTTSCLKLSGKAYEECIERREEREKERKEREKAKKMKEANVRNYYEQRRKQKQEKFKERDEEKERLPAKGGRLGGGGVGGTTTSMRALDEDAFGGADVDAMQTIREATVLEKPLERLEGGSGGKFAFPEEDGIHKADVMALQPCAGGKSSGAETTWLDAPERFERQNV